MGYKVEVSDDPDDSNYAEIVSPPQEVKLLIQRVKHPSRVHLDIETDDLEAEVVRLEKLGAKKIAHVKGWYVMEAPTGQRFCVVQPQREDFEENANRWE